MGSIYKNRKLLVKANDFYCISEKNAYLCMRDTTHVSCTQNITKIISKNEKNHLYGNSLDNGCKCECSGGL